MEEVLAPARRRGLLVIEDACQAHGARYRDRSVGTFGRLGCFSFYPSKNLGAYGDGGAIVTNSKRLFSRLIMLRNYGQSRKYIHDTIGINSRLDALQAAILRAKLKHLNQWVSQRRRAAGLYRGALADLPEVVVPLENSRMRHAH